MMLKLAFILLTLLSCSACFGQTQLLVKGKKNFFYKKGDEITLGIDDHKISGKIAAFTDSSFFLQSRGEIPIKQIEMIYRSNPRSGSIGKIYVAALLFPLIEMANSGDSPHETTLKISSVLAASGLALQLLHRKKHKIKNSSQVLILN